MGSETKSRVKSVIKSKDLCFLLLFFFLSQILFGSYLFADEQNKGSAPPRYQVETLKNISTEQGKKYLAQLGIGTASQIPGINKLLITGEHDELVKASAVLRLVDAEQQFIIKPIFPAQQAQNLPSNDEIAAKIGDISIGTFSMPPSSGAENKAIIDIHNNSVIAIAPFDQLEKIISVVEQQSILRGTGSAKEIAKDEELKAGGKTQIQQLQKTKTISDTKADIVVPAEPNRILPTSVRQNGNEPEPDRTVEKELYKIASSMTSEKAGTDANENQKDEFLDKLIDPLIESEERTTQQPNVPGGPAADSNQVEQPVPKVTEQPPKIDKTVKESPTEEAVEKPKPEKQLKPEAEQPEVASKLTKEVELEIEEKPGIQLKVAEPNDDILTYEPEPIKGGDQELELDLPESLEVVALLDFVGKYLDLDYMYDASKVKGQVSLRVQGPIKVKELYPLLESVMKFRGFVMTRKGNLVTIVPQEEALDIDPALYTGYDKIKYGDVIITRIFKLKYMDTESAKNLLTGMKLGVSIEAIPLTQSLAVTGYAYRMARIQKMLKMVDLPGKPRKFRFRQLRYTMAETLAPKIEKLAEQLGTVTITFEEPEVEIKRRRGESSQAFAARRRRAEAEAKKKGAGGAEPSVYLDADERTNRILMIGFDEQLDVVDELIDTLDVEQQDLRTMRLYEIRYVGAEEIMEKLAELGMISGTGKTTTGRTTRRGKREPAAEEIEEPLVEEPQVVIIESTNSLLVNATTEQHAQIAMIIGFMDIEPEETSIKYVVYPLENQAPEDLSAVLNQLIKETITSDDAKGGDKIQRTTTTTARRPEEEIIIIPDENTFSIIVYASKKNQQWIESLIRQLDKRRPQVLIDVTLVEISKTDIFTLDLDLVSKFPKLEPGETMDKLSSLLPGEGSGGFPEKRITEATVLSGAGLGFYSDQHIQVLLDAVQTKNYGRVLARPKILVNDNEEGSIQTTETTYVTRTETIVIPGDPPTQTESIVDKDYEAGITLDITPHISEGELLRLDIKMTRSDFGIITGDKPPDRANNIINTVITVPDKSTIILGGMERLNQSKGGTKTPLLGDIPLVGGLFRSTGNSDIQKRLYIFVKAHILRPEETIAETSDIEVVSGRNRAVFEKYEGEMQKYEDWPGIKPKPMDPLKILEAD